MSVGYKRGPKVGEYPHYVARYSKPPLTLPYDMALLVERRTRPFLDSIGMCKPLAVLLQEAYLQGMQDVLDAQTPRPEEPTPNV